MLSQTAEAGWFNDLVPSQKIQENTKTALSQTVTGERSIENLLEEGYEGNKEASPRKKK